MHQPSVLSSLRSGLDCQYELIQDALLLGGYELKRIEMPYMLVDKQYANILSLSCELLECALYRIGLGLVVHDQVVLLRIRWVGDMLFISSVARSSSCAVDESPS